MKKLIIAGGTGFLGQALVAHFKSGFGRIVILSRGKARKEGNVDYLQWDAESPGSWCEELEGADAVINLCGKSVDCRYTAKNKMEILSSRLNSTGVIGEAILRCKNPPALWINGASATIYRSSENEPMSELYGETGSGFSVDVCKAWEKVFDEFRLPNIRKVNLRISMVLGTSGGVLPVLMNLVKKGLGGTMGSGRQQVSWVHINDFCRIVEWLMAVPEASGVYNVVTPQPVRNWALMKLLRHTCGIRIGLPAAEWMLKIGAFLIGTETELILKSRYSFPYRLLKEGYVFRYDTIEKCIGSLVKGTDPV